MSKSNTINQLTTQSYERLLSVMQSAGSTIRIDACNDFVLPKDWGFKNRRNSNFHIGYVRKGKGHYKYNSIQDPMTKDKLYFFSNHCTHSRVLDIHDLPHMILIRFSIYDNQGRIVQPDTPFAFSQHVGNTICPQLLSDLHRHCNSFNDVHNEEIGKLILKQLLYHLLIIQLKSTEPIDHRIEKAIAHIHTNIHCSLSLDTLSRIAGLSENYFRKVFKKHMNMYPKDYIIHTRTNRAKQLLMETDLPISAIAEQLGYSDTYCLSKQFKKRTGFAPSYFRRKAQF